VSQAFFLGALSRALATVLIFPCIRTKKLLMADKHHALKDADAHEPEAVSYTAQSRLHRLGRLQVMAAGCGDAHPVLCCGVQVMSGKESIMGTLKKTVEQDGVGALFQVGTEAHLTSR
jgi:hypothetical protein